MKIKILSPVQHGLKLYGEGDVADIAKDDAAELIKVGAAEEFDPKAEAAALAEANALAKAAEEAAEARRIQDEADAKAAAEALANADK